MENVDHNTLDLLNISMKSNTKILDLKDGYKNYNIKMYKSVDQYTWYSLGILPKIDNVSTTSTSTVHTTKNIT